MNKELSFKHTYEPFRISLEALWFLLAIQGAGGVKSIFEIWKIRGHQFLPDCASGPFPKRGEKPHLHRRIASTL